MSQREELQLPPQLVWLVEGGEVSVVRLKENTGLRSAPTASLIHLLRGVERHSLQEHRLRGTPSTTTSQAPVEVVTAVSGRRGPTERLRLRPLLPPLTR